MFEGEAGSHGRGAEKKATDLGTELEELLCPDHVDAGCRDQGVPRCAEGLSSCPAYAGNLRVMSGFAGSKFMVWGRLAPRR